MKRVILLVIDALTAEHLINEMDAGRYPHFQQLREAGILRDHCVSIFPSITHAALASIATGTYPSDHGIVGSHWYDTVEEKVAYFSSSLGMLLQKGPGEFFREFMLELNHEHLRAPTIFQSLERDGYEAACINFLIYRGDVDHELNVPLLLKWIPGLPASANVKGPRALLLGDLLADPDRLDVAATHTGLTDWFGFRDKNTIELVLQMAERDAFPDFTLAYFPENDDRAHNDGPAEAHKHLSDIDEMLGELIRRYDGIASFLQRFMLVITGDHSQSETLADEAEEGIDLSEVLASHHLAVAGQPWRDQDEIMPCPNSRAAHLYFKSLDPALIKDVITRLEAEPRIDQLICLADLLQEGAGYVVRSRTSHLHFWHDSAREAVDRYGNSWAWSGDLSAVDGRQEGKVLTFHDYPNAFERIAGVLDCDKSGHLWLTAKVGHEFVVPNIKAFPAGGSHGSLHRLDSLAPLIVAGAPDPGAVPEFPRIVDVAPLCRAALREG